MSGSAGGRPEASIEQVLVDCSRQLTALLGALREEPDVTVRLSTASHALAQLRQEEAIVTALRDECIVALAARGRTYQEIALAGGITRGRVAHIVTRARGEG